MENHMSCSVCHEGITFCAVGCCDHVICYKCSCRMRVLCEQFYCPICRTDLPQVYLVKQAVKFGDIPRYGFIPNRKSKIFFENEEIKNAFDKLLENRCKICTHSRAERTFKDLQNHIRKQHTLFYCSLCVEHLKLFPSERKFYNRHDLAVHRRQGDKDDSSYKGHPLCEFCDERYMDKDELYRHLRKEHFFCHFCDPEGCSEFYNDYPSLKDHFREKHYLCEEGACSQPEVRLTHAFRSRIDLQAHTTAEHASNLTKAQAKQLRTIDINYQLPPRDRRRDRGAVNLNAGDNEDIRSIPSQVFHNSRGRGGHSGKSRYEDSRGFRKSNFSEEDMKQAINASLDVMKDKEKEVKVIQEEVTEKEKMVHDEENFPTLGGKRMDRLTDSPVDSDHKDSDSEAPDYSMAKQIALKNKRSVQYGRLVSQEFPTLSGESSSKSLKDSSENVDRPKSVPVSKPHIVPKSTTKPISKVTSAVSHGLVQPEDFPGLPTKKSTINSALGSASWLSKQPNKESKQAAAMPVQVTSNKTNNNHKSSKGGKPQKSFNDDNDFPVLGGQPVSKSDKNINWLQKSGKEKSKPKSDKKSKDWFDANDNFEYSIENVTKIITKDNHDDRNTSSSENKKKKKKKEKNKSPDLSVNTGSSLDSIASSLFNTKDTSKKSEVVKMESPKMEKKQVSEERTSPVSFKTVDKKVKPIKADENKFSLLSDEQDVSAIIDIKPVAPVRRKDVSLKLDDFPALGSANSSKAPPPGFAKPQPTSIDVAPKKPPGFDDATSGKRPPPGFSMPMSSSQNGHVTPEEKKCTFTLKNIMPTMTEISNFEYVPLGNASERNKKLIQDILTQLRDKPDSFDQFKSVSAAFRQGDTDATKYYNKCEELIGKENFNRIFPELLVLLPDINKQQDLLTTYKTIQDRNKEEKVVRISGKSAPAPWKQTADLQSCPTCKQVILSSDMSDHTTVHSNSSDFPSLGIGGGPALRGWVKGK